MLHIFYGDDDFSIHEALEHLKAMVQPPDLLDANVSRAQVSSLSLQQLVALCHAVPFLASRRMVIVDGLLALFEDRRAPRGGRGSRGSQGEAANTPSPWLSLDKHIPTMPPSTDLVLVERVRTLRKDNVLLKRLSPLGQVTGFPSLRGQELGRWVEERAAERGCSISRGGVRLLAELVGGNLWAMSSEIEKLSLYCQGRTVEAEDVSLLVSTAMEKTIFNAVDAIMEGRHSEALRVIRRLMEGGASGPYIVTMIARQGRLVLLFKDMERRGVPPGQMGTRLGLSADWMLRRVMGQGRRYSQAALESLHRGLLETDRAIKSGQISEESVGEFLIEVFTRVSLAQKAAR
ncbi:MAG: polymerase delta subunit [Dehalococcoidia bacterium]|nr:polymerase delta subunit [Dehalococcoidia bacterium]